MWNLQGATDNFATSYRLFIETAGAILCKIPRTLEKAVQKVEQSPTFVRDLLILIHLSYYHYYYKKFDDSENIYLTIWIPFEDTLPLASSEGLVVLLFPVVGKDKTKIHLARKYIASKDDDEILESQSSFVEKDIEKYTTKMKTLVEVLMMCSNVNQWLYVAKSTVCVEYFNK